MKPDRANMQFGDLTIGDVATTTTAPRYFRRNATRGTFGGFKHRRDIFYFVTDPVRANYFAYAPFISE